ncbi:SgcJ/EcaC family oxidoreductase [Mesorhizobium sp.]|uniref:SgcJ/EcaC family oxidoreductase n=1 Tax=Mesorhizobium sp. TaxID=1871066 RepID=UPI00121D51FC|nr:SgcJ/EcaC family oxidoreductase [Mesorhizobium sp.]TIO08602.1 MAG: SgcJ/EcaC family oxidoreductase [Mesorhizobium sp.]TIO33752.1 MAG: SgcJ/EcaC family oxidoreductase [Mesorhizobium sp.]
MATDKVGTEEVEGIAHRLIEAWNRHDPHAFAAVFAADAEFTNVFGMQATGRGKIELFHAPIFETMFKDSHLSADSVRSRLVRPDVATLDLRWSMTGARDPMGNEWPRRRGLISLMATRDHDEWMIATMHNMELENDQMAKSQEKLQEGQ